MDISSVANPVQIVRWTTNKRGQLQSSPVSESELRRRPNVARYAIYARVSTKKQNEEGVGLDVQISACRKFVCAKHPLQGAFIVSEVCETLSGGSESLVIMEALLERCSTLAVPTIVVKRGDRLSRGTRRRAKLLDLLDRHRVKLVFEEGGEFNDDRDVILAGVAEYERRTIANRVRNTAAHNRELQRASTIEARRKNCFWGDKARQRAVIGKRKWAEARRKLLRPYITAAHRRGVPLTQIPAAIQRDFPDLKESFGLRVVRRVLAEARWKMTPISDATSRAQHRRNCF